MDIQLTDKDLTFIRALIYKQAGISISPHKRALITGRLDKRVRALGFTRYAEYIDYIQRRNTDRQEIQHIIDALTTNETYFFREPKHFTFLESRVLPAQVNSGKTDLRVWSCACSSGEEPYSIAMTLSDDYRLNRWHILATDLNTQVLDVARAGIYPMARAEKIPPEFLKKYCLKGIGKNDGKFIINKNLRHRIEYKQLNLNTDFPRDVGKFDVIFLRNVMIYFDLETKKKLCAKLINCLVPGGYLIIGHSESLNGVTDALSVEAPSIYRNR